MKLCLLHVCPTAVYLLHHYNGVKSSVMQETCISGVMACMFSALLHQPSVTCVTGA